MQISIRERFINWFIQKAIYGTKELNFSLHFTSRVTQSQSLKLGKNVWPYLARSGHCYIQAINGVEIGDNTIIAPGVKIISANHSVVDYKKHDPKNAIKIGRNCWLAANSIILPGVELGDNVIVGAGAVVTTSFPAYSIVGGVPAKLIKKLESD